MYWCMFEQSGTFKNEFKKLGYDAVDLDISNDFGETDYVMDLFNEILNAFNGYPSVFDSINENDVVLAFFPCIRFSKLANFSVCAYAHQYRDLPIKEKVLISMKYEKERSFYYGVLCKFVYVCCLNNIKLVIENPYSKDSYLTRYFPMKPAIVDMDRTDRGDSFEKPTQYFFVNFEPKNNFVFESVEKVKKKSLIDSPHGIRRSLIQPGYANRFIREFLI